MSHTDPRYIPKEDRKQLYATSLHIALLKDHADYMDDLAKTAQQECEGIEDRCSEATERIERLEAQNREVVEAPRQDRVGG